MRRPVCCLLSLMFLLAPLSVLAEALPEPVAAVFAADPRWEGYVPVAHTPYGSAETGHAWEIALVMQKEGHNVLCILERTEESEAYALSIANENAVLQGDILPSLMIDTGGGALFYTYTFDDGEVSTVHYISMKANGAGDWGPVGAEVFAHPGEDGSVYEWYAFSDGEHLIYSHRLSDENGNLLRDDGEVRVAAKVDTALAVLDINALPLTFQQAQAMYAP